MTDWGNVEKVPDSPTNGDGADDPDWEEVEEFEDDSMICEGCGESIDDCTCEDDEWDDDDTPDEDE